LLITLTAATSISSTTALVANNDRHKRSSLSARGGVRGEAAIFWAFTGCELQNFVLPKKRSSVGFHRM
ncbi:MAG TPA: hypothetical protein VMW12_02635, partial [Candidatus Dormibacteraeota bacterium]|nr:hypothetical protein [Candidatus Dormibacteraeota bacterium]